MYCTTVRLVKTLWLYQAQRFVGVLKLEEIFFFGAGVNIKQHCQIGNFVTLGIGSNVISDVAARTTVAGNPARTLSKPK